MREETKSIRQEQIEQAAYAVLQEKGYAGASMLAVAKRARASNETLYNWYGDKQGLFMALVARNAAEVKALLQAQITADADPLDTLRLLGPRLLDLLTGDRSVALNRAAAADPSGELGTAISRAGRETVAPMIEAIMSKARSNGLLDFHSKAEATELYLNLLIGDLQIRRVIGRADKPTDSDIAHRADRAVRILRLALAP